MSGDVKSRHDDQGLNQSEHGPSRLRGLCLATATEVRRPDHMIDDALGEDVPNGWHGHRMTRGCTGSRFTRWRILKDIGKDPGGVLHLHFMDPPVGTITVHQPFNQQSRHSWHCIAQTEGRLNLPFKNLIEPFDDDDGAEEFGPQRPLKCEDDGEVQREHVLGIEHFRHVNEESLAVGKSTQISSRCKSQIQTWWIF